MDYQEFIASKTVLAKSSGFDVSLERLNPLLKPWQAVAVQWGLRKGRGALFEGCGLGKTFQQEVWGEQIVLRENKPVLLLCPLGVRHQTIAEASKFGISVDVKKLDTMADVTGPGIYVSNYEKLHKIDAGAFVGVIPDESSVLKGYTSATKQKMIEMFADTRYKLPCTATPSPNDHMELGNHSEFLNALPSNEMLSRWFINDSMKSGGYILLNHAKKDFWRWVCSWAICLSKPSDLGDFSNEGYDLPGIEYSFVTVDIEDRPPEGLLFSADAINATTMHREKRESAEARAAKVAEIVATDPDDYWIVWCDTDYEADELVQALPDAVEVRGSDAESYKENSAAWFTGNLCRCQLTTKRRRNKLAECGNQNTTTNDVKDTQPILTNGSVGKSKLELRSKTESTCENTISQIKTSSKEQEISKTLSTKLAGESTGKTKNTGKNASEFQDHEQMSSDAMVDCGPISESERPNTKPCLPNREGDVPFAEKQKPTHENTNCTSTILTSRELYGDFYVADAISGSASSWTMSGSWKKRCNICGRPEETNRKIISKSEIFGFGLNFQHCRNVVFIGLSYSFERFLQALSRAYRFGQTRIVRVWVIQSETEAAITETVLRKKTAYQEMFEAMAEAMRDTQIENIRNERKLTKYVPENPMTLPAWLAKPIKRASDAAR